MIWGGVVALLIFGGLSVSVVMQVIPCLRRIAGRSRPAASAGPCPRAQVILSLKGTDPFLDRCLARLAAQDYPDYQVTVVVDSYDDPAWEQAVAARDRFGRDVVDLRVRAHSSTTCTRKLSNLLTAFETLPADVEVVALCDGDAVVHSTWLRELVSGLNNPEVAAVSANRWFSPPGCGFAELSRHYWNALAIPTTQEHRILWAGSLALRRSIVDEPEFRAAFGEGFSDDTLIASYLHKTGREYDVIGSTYVINSETTSIRSYWNFLVRQMLCVRLHHPRWMPIFLHALTLAVGIGVVLPLLMASGLAIGAVGYAAFTVYGLTLLVLTSLYEQRLRGTFPDHRSLNIPVTAKRVLMALPALLLTSVIYPAATIVAACTRTHLWRGVEYRLEGGKVVEAVDTAEASCRPLMGDGVARPHFLEPSLRESSVADANAAVA